MNRPSDCGASAIRSSVGLPVEPWPERGSDDTGDFAALLPRAATNSGASVHERTTALTTVPSSIAPPPITGARAGAHVSLCLRWKRSTSREMIFAARWSGIVGSQKAQRTVAIVRLAQIRRTGQDLFVRIIRIGADAVTAKQPKLPA